MKIVLDFDDTLFNTHALMRELIKIFTKEGFSEDQFWGAYKECKERSGDLDKFLLIDLLCALKTFDKNKVSAEIDRIIERSNEFIYQDFFDFIAGFEKKDLILLSFGVTDFQKIKIGNSEISKYFGEVIITSKNKADNIEEIRKKYAENLIFIDDKASQIDEAKKRFPEIIAVKMERERGGHILLKSELADHIVKNLGEAKKIINELNK